MWVVETSGNAALLQVRTAAACLSLLRRGARLVMGDKAVLLALLAEQEQAVLRGLREDVPGVVVASGNEEG